MIMVIGGYGQVGGFVSKQINNVIVAGRNQSKASDFMRNNNINGIYRYIDTNNLKECDFLEVDTIIMCVESNNFQVLLNCLQYKINYVDISPSYDVLSEIIEYRQQIEESGIRCILGVGIAPGISNLLCKEASQGMEQVKSIDSYLMLGIGESHGENALLWFLQHIYSDTPGINSFIENEDIILHRNKGKYKQRMARIDLADSHIMQQKYSGAKCQSWFAYDVNWITKVICFMKKTGIFRSLKSKCASKRTKAYDRFLKILHIELRLASMAHIGTDEYAVQIKVCGMCNGEEVERELHINGNCNSKITATVAACISKKMDQIPTGLHYVDDIMDLSEIK